eukprot:6036568-Prymnesium_polylepis.1
MGIGSQASGHGAQRGLGGPRHSQWRHLNTLPATGPAVRTPPATHTRPPHKPQTLRPRPAVRTS